jgi:hypothetical protein
MPARLPATFVTRTKETRLLSERSSLRIVISKSCLLVVTPRAGDFKNRATLRPLRRPHLDLRQSHQIIIDSYPGYHLTVDLAIWQTSAVALPAPENDRPSTFSSRQE